LWIGFKLPKKEAQTKTQTQKNQGLPFSITWSMEFRKNSRSTFSLSLLSFLQSIFVPYFGYFLDNCVQILSQSPDDSTSKEETQMTNHLIETVLSSLTKCFLFDAEGFINKDKFDKLLLPLVNQLDNTTGDQYKTRTENFLVPCLAQLAVCVGNDVSTDECTFVALLK
jgi:U3 small nucleolar RNA-associated protein 10